MSSNETPVSEIMTSPIRTVGSDVTIVEAARDLTEHGIGSLLVVDDHIEGIVTETDIVVSVADETDPATSIAAVMSSPVVTARPTESVGAAGRRMAKNDVKKLPVTQDGEPLGIVTTTDLAHFTARSR